MNDHPTLLWTARRRRLELGRRTLVMGVLNVTPDSFSDGGRFLDPARALEQARRMIAGGADLLDVGGESTRPGAAPVPGDEEIRRVLPVIEAIRAESDIPISVDTAKAAVAARALEAGADVINDVTALAADPAMPAVAARYGAGVILMHMQGTPRTMQADPRYADVVREVRDYLAGRIAALAAQGLAPETLAVDPGIGFGKTLEHNVALLHDLDTLAGLGRPVVVGLSRKSFLGRITGREAGERLAGGLGAAAWAIARGAHVIRAHDVKETCDMVRVVDMLRKESAT
ncbi:MAG TPA: dihydropteroate synthase [Kiritimatiellia bacterium]|nr:dihydropteroate synthase [Kiritimatiellia bacterium]HRZ13147.1 dihydropteroate synthase [Kiritimatiellia bacterium]HSA17568.1 dihydropteroate synthase [Kiritimatiellia bacterium]